MYNIVWYGMVWYSNEWYNMVWYNVSQLELRAKFMVLYDIINDFVRCDVYVNYNK